MEEIEGGHSASTLAAVGARARFGQFLRRFVQLVERDGRLELRELAGAEAAILSARPSAPVDNPQISPLRIVSVDVHGQLSTFSPELMGANSPPHGDFVFGDVREGQLEAILHAPAFIRVRREIATGVRRCAACCAYFQVCGGGVPSDKFFETGSLEATETMFCRLARQEVIEVVLEALERRLAPVAASA